MFAPITSALIEAAAIKDGDSVLDVAGGSGEPSLTIAGAAEPSTSFTFTDAVGEMVAISRDAGVGQRLSNIEFAQCVGEALPFLSDSFDVVVCRLGVMLFPDPVRGNCGRCCASRNPVGESQLRCGAREIQIRSSMSWRTSCRATSTLRPKTRMRPELSVSPTRVSWPTCFGDSGAIEVIERVVGFTLEAPLTPAQFWEVRTELSDTLRAKVAELSPEQVSRVAQEVEQAGRAFYQDGRMRFPAEVLVVTGRKL